jgi:hypothetical protein
LYYISNVHTITEERNILLTKNKGKLSGLDTSCGGNYLKNTLFKGRWKRQKDEREDVSSYWIMLRKQEGTGSRNRKH